MRPIVAPPAAWSLWWRVRVRWLVAAVDAGADFLLVLNAGAYRSLGAGCLASFLAYGNANDQTDRRLREHILPSCGNLPIVARVFASDPTCALVDRLGTLRELSVAGITNWPAVGFVDGEFRRLMETEGVGGRSREGQSASC